MARYSVKPIKLGTMLANLDDSMIIKVVSQKRYQLNSSDTVRWWKKLFEREEFNSALGRDIIRMDVRPEFNYSGPYMLRLFIE